MSQRPKRTPSKPLRYRRDVSENSVVGGVQAGVDGHCSANLPGFEEIESVPKTSWNGLTGQEFADHVNRMYDEVVKW